MSRLPFPLQFDVACMLGSELVTQPDHDDAIERGVGLSVATAVEPMPVRLAAVSGCIWPTSRRDPAHALRDMRRPFRRDGSQACDRGSACARPSGDAAGVHSG